MFEYDPQIPLDLSIAGERSGERCTVLDASYASPLGGRVPAYIVVPGPGAGSARPKRFAGLVFLHHGQGNRTTYLAEAEALAPSVSFR